MPGLVVLSSDILYYRRITIAPDRTVFEHVATAANGWHAVKVGSQVGWVSGKYSEITTT